MSGANYEAITTKFLEKKVADLVTDYSPLMMRLLANAKPWKGRKYTKAVKVASGPTGAAVSGYDTWEYEKADTKRLLEFDPKMYRKGFSIEGLERDVAATDPEAAVDLVANTLEEAANEGGEEFGRLLFTSYGNNPKEPMGLKGLVDDGTVLSTWGGLSRTDYPVLKGNRFAPGTGLASFAPMQLAYDAAVHGKDHPDIIVSTLEKFSDFEDLLQAVMQFNVPTQSYATMTRNNIVKAGDGLRGDVGFNALFYRGIPFVSDDLCEEDKMYMLNTNEMFWSGIKSKSKKYHPIMLGGNKTLEGKLSKIPAQNAGFNISDLMDSWNQYVEAGNLLILGNLVSFRPNRHSVTIFNA